MKTKQWLVVVAVVSMCDIGAGQTTMEDVEKAIIEKNAKLTAWQGKTTTTTENPGSDMKLESRSEVTLECLKQGDIWLSRKEGKTQTTSTVRGHELKTEQAVLSINDGKFIYAVVEHRTIDPREERDHDGETNVQRTAVKSKAPPAKMDVVDKAYFDNQRKHHTLKLLPDDKVDGKACWVIEATAINPHPRGPTTVLFSYDQESGLPVKTVAKNSEGKTLMTSTTSDIKLNPELAVDRFVFKAPEGVSLVDATAAGVAAATRRDAQEAVPTPWGELRSLGSKYHPMYSAVLTSRPKDGRMVVPEGTAPIVHAGAFLDGKLVSLPLEFDPQSGQLIVPLPEKLGTKPGGGVMLRAAIVTAQDSGGSIIFPAQTARIVGETAKLESSGANHRIDFWTNPQDRVEWDYEASRWGRYAVTLVYSTPCPDGAVATIEFGGDSIDIELPSTGDWYRYVALDAGKIYLADAGKQKLTVKAKKLSGRALMSLKAVLLDPTFESDERIVQSDDGSITLQAKDAKVSGVKLRYEPKPDKNTLGYWTTAGESALWRYEIRKPGTFDIEVLQGCGEAHGGSIMQIYGDGIRQIISFRVEETGHFQNFVRRIVGRTTIDKAGPASLTVNAHRIAKTAACDIRQIRLIPVGTAAEGKPQHATDEIKSLTREQAELLVSQHNVRPLSLNGLTTLSPEVAKALAQHETLLSLNGLTEISPEAATALAQHEGALTLDGLTALSDDVAEALAQHEGSNLLLNGLTTLSEEAAKALAGQRGKLCLNGLTTLSKEVATALAQHKGWLLTLNGLATLSEEAATALAQHEGTLTLDGLTTLSDEAAKALAQHKGRRLNLNGLTTLSEEAAMALAGYKGELFLIGLTTLSDEAAKALWTNSKVALPGQFRAKSDK